MVVSILIIFLLVKVYWHGFIYSRVFAWPLCKVISEKRGEAHIREFMPQKDFFFANECKYFCAAK